MKYIFTLFVLIVNLEASIYYAKVEPYEVYHLRAIASGEVMSVFDNLEGMVSAGGVVLQIDDYLNKKELKSSKIKLTSLMRTSTLTNSNVENLKLVGKIKENSYRKIKKLKTKSQTSKDDKFINLINTNNQILNLENSLENLKRARGDLEFKIASLKRVIKNKKIEVKKGYFIYKIHVTKGEFVNIGSPLVDIYDVTKGKLTLFLPKEDIEKIKNSKIYVNDKLSDYKIQKVWKIADEKNISSYKAEIIIPAPKYFSKLLKIELK